MKFATPGTITLSVVVSFYVGYQMAKFANGLPLELGMMDLLMLPAVGSLCFYAYRSVRSE